MTSRARKILVSLFSFASVLLVSAAAYAQPMAPSANNFERDKWIALAAGFGIAIAAFGGALGQAKTAATALDGIARNPGAAGKIFTPMILGLALIESLVIYSLLISFLLQGKIGG